VSLKLYFANKLHLLIMKNNYILILLNFCVFTFVYGQKESLQYVDPTNCREGETVEYCITHKMMQELLNNPSELQKFRENREIQKESLLKVKTGGIEKGVIYKIPVVFHVLHNGGVENISRAQILDALFILNRDFKRENIDANNVNAAFQGMPIDCEIEFVLATKAPNGNCFGGITRTQSILTSNLGDDSNGNSLDNVEGTDQVDAIVAGNDVYQGDWPGNKYLNIFVCKVVNGAAGYTYNPWSSDMSTGIFVLHNYVGSIGTSDESHSRTLTHESGHWFNLSHTWGGNNNPGNASSCDEDDEVDDTPVCIGVTSCAMTSNSCDDLNTSWNVTSSWTYDVVDNVENYMDYSYCSKMFTPGQKDRMRAALISSTAGRNNLWTSSNLLATGANGTTTICKADFLSDKKIICAGDSITFTDDSYNAPSGWTWTTTGGSPSSSTLQNPTIVYNSPGFYSVTLTATDGGTSDSETKTSYIHVLPVASAIPFYDGFESYSNLDNLDLWSVYDQGANRPYTLYSGTGYSGSKCIKLNNYSETSSGSIDEFISSKIDLSSLNSTDNVTLSFRFSYKKKNSTNSESLKIMASNNCGSTWTTRKTISGTTLGTLTSSSAWTPTTISDWTTVHVTSISSIYFNSDFRFKFNFTGNGGNNLYIDDINIYQGDPSDVIVLSGVSENSSILSELEVFPNPTEGELNVHFSIPSDENVSFQIQDITGKITHTQTVKAITGSNLVLLDTSILSSGIYFINLRMNSEQKTIQFVVK